MYQDGQTGQVFANPWPTDSGYSDRLKALKDKADKAAKAGALEDRRKKVREAIKNIRNESSLGKQNEMLEEWEKEMNAIEEEEQKL